MREPKVNPIPEAYRIHFSEWKMFVKDECEDLCVAGYQFITDAEEILFNNIRYAVPKFEYIGNGRVHAYGVLTHKPEFISHVSIIPASPSQPR